MSLIKNAVYAIESGIEDYETGDEKRNISAVRNIYAGILLLFKEKLARLSPPEDQDLLIKKKLIPSINEKGELVFKGNGNSINIEDIKERFKSLGVKIDVSRLNDINSLRNDIEHYYTKESPEKVREIIAKSFLIIRDFLTNELNENPVDLIDKDCWSNLLEVEEVYSAEEKTCRNSFKNFKWKYDIINKAIKHIRCDFCDSSLVKLVEHEPYKYSEIGKISFSEYRTKMCCSSCGEENDHFPTLFEKCIEKHFFTEAYLAHTKGGELPFEECPECNMNTFVWDKGCCIACNYKPEYKSCSRCGNYISLVEQDLNGLCSYCENVWHKMAKE